MAGVVERVNQWQAQGGRRVLNVETLLLPVGKRDGVKPSDGGSFARWDEDYHWVQVVRVWHEPAPEAVMPPVLTEPASGTLLESGQENIG
jgi:hypothetical protein